MGGSRCGAGGAINKKKQSIVVRKNRLNMLNRKNRIEQINNRPQFTSRPISKKKQRQLLKRTGLNEFHGTHSRQIRSARKDSTAMGVESGAPEDGGELVPVPVAVKKLNVPKLPKSNRAKKTNRMQM